MPLSSYAPCISGVLRLKSDSDEAGEGKGWRGDRCVGWSSAGFCSGEAELEAARRSRSSSLFLSFLR